ncbi:MAG: GNAT family N-acetyltransferase, partial [Candidatus Limnocylindrales bacterium]
MSSATPDPAGRTIRIEEALERHWRLFGLYPGAHLRDEDGVLSFGSPIRHLPYNGVIRTHVAEDAYADAVLTRTAESFRTRDVPFMWIVRPSDHPTDLERRLAGLGLDLVETAIGMDLDLDDWHVEPNGSRAEIRHVDVPGADPAGLHDYEELIRTYWSVPEDERHMIETLNRHWTGERSPGQRLVAYLDGHAVGKCFVRLADLPDSIAIFGVAVRPEARGGGIATALMNEAISMGSALGARHAVLHSSSMAWSMYRRLGFIERCRLPVYATDALFGTHHHWRKSPRPSFGARPVASGDATRCH